uniref:Glycosyltransferase n=1 Tax=Oryza barthii TaxID=65489 RepID=A0A0D3GA06_9ORYZ
MGKAALLRFPGMPPIRTVDMPATLRGDESEVSKVRLYQFKRMTEAKGVLVNSFEWLQPKALKALAAGVCVPDKPTPRVYCIGPLVDAGKKAEIGGERHACLAWLDAQPRRSVVFLCFGSKGAFPAAQLKEIARGLESSSHRFLWVVRSPPEEQSTSPEPDLERLLPAGFLERTKGRGMLTMPRNTLANLDSDHYVYMTEYNENINNKINSNMVVKNWVPQAEVVQHEAVGAFVTHCGWNSTLEAIMSALPMICWPLYAEQAMNKVIMVEEMKIAVPLDGYEEGGLVKAEEVEAKVRLVMETEEGRKLREKLVETRDMALDAVNKGPEGARRRRCVPDKPTPRVYCIGPLVNAGKKAEIGGERHACLAWLDAQPRRSVVFLCFGSQGAFPAAQLKEIARGLESSGHRFLWVVRSPPEEQTTSPELDLERLLPAGFLERTKDRGMVVKNWVPQAEVVQHEAVGAFVTHCGWNSTLEAIMSALPMICWPLYAEQAMNKVIMVEEMKIAVSLDGYEEGGLVKAEEVEAKVRLVMETEEGRKLREKLVETRDMALDAITEGGSSEMAFDMFMRDLEESSLENGVRS